MRIFAALALLGLSFAPASARQSTTAIDPATIRDTGVGPAGPWQDTLKRELAALDSR